MHTHALACGTDLDTVYSTRRAAMCTCTHNYAHAHIRTRTHGVLTRGRGVQHTAQPCPEFKTSKTCPRSDKCQMAHGP
eukprot:3007279-Rhodomonas_salina.1